MLKTWGELGKRVKGEKGKEIVQPYFHLRPFFPIFLPRSQAMLGNALISQA
jgi:hypothetical protein